MNKIVNTRSFTVVEVLIAMVVIVLALSASIMTTRSSLGADQDSLDYGLAESLAEEGIEMALNVIDTNLLKYSAYKDVCWNYWKQHDIEDEKCDDVLANGDNNDKFAVGYYTVYIDPDDKVIVIQGDDSPANGTYANETDDPSKFVLHKAKIAGTNEIFYVNYNNMPSGAGKDQGKYNILDLGTGETKFYRSIKIEYPDIYPVDGSEDDDKIDVISRVWWQNRGRVSQFSVSETFYMSFE